MKMIALPVVLCGVFILGCEVVPPQYPKYSWGPLYAVKISPVPKLTTQEYNNDPLNYYQDGFSELFFN